MSDLNKHLRNSFKDRLAIINGQEYISLDVLQEAVSELALSDAVIGAIGIKYGSLDITDDEILNYIENQESVEIIYKDGLYSIKKNNII